MQLFKVACMCQDKMRSHKLHGLLKIKEAAGTSNNGSQTLSRNSNNSFSPNQEELLFGKVSLPGNSRRDTRTT